ncbi:YggS family pyridoxal phosphate-dependent enzyme [Phormidesmis priestleyi ULC007]|uniref:Pyridoxal phosphate homeostasis protein n=1 Tax=Phormidesmis priestleyi ULC007 TaxID=1920490 RepID=A0A2T1DL38_9CYAN|nr:YggS family pyridoxal phosphate-dependent enzyme [Phormidesmis priestleyi]PSB21217.1 YggS family pyridoxal phosphate-dependent enzyme [Phormidesmis priestleyi ULC007]PZO51255.1 MAG: YggS family pyridoxal phosphate-dependent enzyme [Phormidesmis priestleyi]
MIDAIDFDLLRDRIVRFCQTVPDGVRVVAVTKQVSVEAMRVAYASGLRDFGENRIQDAEIKQAQLADLPDITWHLIGHLQANKAKKALEQFQWIHSVDSLKLAQRLNQLAADRPQKPQICLQVKLLPDPNKFGWTEPELWADLPQLGDCEHLQIRGLMTIAPLGLSATEIFDLFVRTRELAVKIQQQNVRRLYLDQLSMGMSEDYLLAVQAGATIIRPGRILFGDLKVKPDE